MSKIQVRIGKDIRTGDVILLGNVQVRLMSIVIETTSYTEFRAKLPNGNEEMVIIQHRNPYKVVLITEPDHIMKGGAINEPTPFTKFTVKQLKKFISDYKHLHNIKNSSRMKKRELIEELSKRFVIIDNRIVMKEDIRPQTQHQPAPAPKEKRRITPTLVQPIQPPQVQPTPAPKEKKRIAPTLVQPIPPQPLPQPVQTNRTAGQRTEGLLLNKLITKTKARANYAKELETARRIRNLKY